MNEKISISYKTQSGELNSLQMPSNSRIEDLKKYLAKQLKSSPDTFLLSLPNKNSLSDSQTLKSLNLNDSSFFIVSAQISEIPTKDYFNQLLKKTHCKDLATFIEIVEDWEESFDIFSLLNSENSEGWTLMHFACYKGASSIVEYLTKRGALCNSESKDAWTPLQLACYNGNTECIKFLIKHPQLQVNRSTSRGTALHIASRRGHSKNLCILLDNGASMTVEDPSGLIPLQVASNEEVFEIIPRYMGLQLISSVTKKEVSFSDIECEVTINKVELIMQSVMNEGNLHFYQRMLDEKREFKVVKIIDIYDMREVTPTFCVFQGKFGIFELTFNSCREVIQNLKLIVNFCLINKIGYVDDGPNELVTQLTKVEMVKDFDQKISISNFQINENLGNFLFGNFYSAYISENSSLYTIKQVSKEKMREACKTFYFVRESKILQQIRHRFIARLFYAFQSKNNLYFVLEHLKFNLTQSTIPETLLNAKTMIAQIVTALEYLHSRDIVYRNLSPSNIWLDGNGNIKLMNFETAREGINTANKAKSFVGTLGFISPEYLSKEGHEKPADIYALGPCLFYMLTGTSIFKGDDARSLLTAIKAGNYSLPYNFPSEVKDFINKVMQKDPILRPNIESVKSLAFLRDVNWADLVKKNSPSKCVPVSPNARKGQSFEFQQISLEDEDSDTLYSDVEDFDYFGKFK